MVHKYTVVAGAIITEMPHCVSYLTVLIHMFIWRLTNVLSNLINIFQCHKCTHHDGSIFCIQEVVKMQNKECENNVFNTLCLHLSPLFKYLLYWQCPISRLCPDTIHIEQGHFLSVPEYLHLNIILIIIINIAFKTQMAAG